MLPLDPQLFRLFLESLEAPALLLDARGEILFANPAWNLSPRVSSAPDQPWPGQNYLTLLNAAAGGGDRSAGATAEGLRRLAEEGGEGFSQDYFSKGPEAHDYYHLKAWRIEYAGQVVLGVLHSPQLQHDALTGLATRQLFALSLSAELGRARRQKQPLSLLMLNTDHLRTINELHGTRIGDECLIAIATLLREHARRPTDLAARYGGDEFVVLLGDTPGTEARRIAEAMRAEIEDLHIAAGPQYLLSVSIGVADGTPGLRHISEAMLLEAAEVALYRARRRGQNRVVWAQTEPDLLSALLKGLS
ncbi:diguanylate cyclase [Uliginosibacterium sp. 31-12]|uniref:diguanylate cyclase domain-containing protein n=1 Tax=Uliginosibacterium sp. 31-12 TaxID=3062781 RepID=UPI0026E1832B|nr:diguanylate cyclase [Uliginosibacterium sp. 31-12]MDO6386388.1 diguanylate cyclase [Uliginosibacterium sp. 31-12]